MNPYATIIFAIALSVPYSSSAQQLRAPQTVVTTSAIQPERLQSEPVLMDTIVVTGKQPGPSLWKVTKGTHELWIMGSLWPIPDSITWNSTKVVDLVSNSQEVLWEPYFLVDADVGFVQKLYLGYQVYRAEKNPNGKKLKDVMSPRLYARWSRVKQYYMPKNRSIERKRPLLAADVLFKAAIRQAGLGQSKIILPAIRPVIQEHGIKFTAPHVTVELSDPRAALKEAQQTVFNDSTCMEATLDAIEQDIPRMVTNANAWATGDIERVRFEQLERRDHACSDAFSNADFARRRGIPDIPASLMISWLDAADIALEHNESTFAVLPMKDIIGPDGYAARLRAKGYSVEPPTGNHWIRP